MVRSVRIIPSACKGQFSGAGRLDKSLALLKPPSLPKWQASDHGIAIDTRAVVRDLETAGAEPKLAEAIVAEVGRSDAVLITDIEAAVSL